MGSGAHQPNQFSRRTALRQGVVGREVVGEGLGQVAVVAMVGWGGWLVLNGNEGGGFWLLWGFLNLVMNRQHPPPLDDVTRVDARRIALGLVALLIFVATFTPSPLREIRLPPGEGQSVQDLLMRLS